MTGSGDAEGVAETTVSGPVEGAEESAEEVVQPPPPLLQLRDGLTTVVDNESSYHDIVSAFAAADGPVALDAERASGYRYSARAYLVQLRREGAGTALIDPIPFGDLSDLQEALGPAEWILHAASQDLACLADVGLRPTSLFDTELAGRLLGYPRVGLATLVEAKLGRAMRKEHSAVDWSTRPLPEPWLEYAALDVEVLVELRDLLAGELAHAGKSEWAAQEFEHLTRLIGTPTRREEAWRRTSGLHKVRGRRALAAVRALWTERDQIAAARDVTPGRIIPDSAIVAAAIALPTDRRSLLGLKGFHGRGAERYVRTWVAALQQVRELADSDLPASAARHDGPPPPRAWADKDPVAAARLSHARAAIAELSEKVNTPVENLITPDTVRRVLWTPPDTTADLPGRLSELGARPWQVDLIGPILVESLGITAPSAQASVSASPAEPVSRAD